MDIVRFTNTFYLNSCVSVIFGYPKSATCYNDKRLFFIYGRHFVYIKLRESVNMFSGGIHRNQRLNILYFLVSIIKSIAVNVICGAYLMYCGFVSR